MSGGVQEKSHGSWGLSGCRDDVGIAGSKVGGRGGTPCAGRRLRLDGADWGTCSRWEAWQGPAAARQVRGDAGLARGGGSAGGRSVTTVVTECATAMWAQRGQGEGRSEKPEGEISRPITPPVGEAASPHPLACARRSGGGS